MACFVAYGGCIWELWHTRLCRHGPLCRHRYDGLCDDAHALTELHAPDERQCHVDYIWKTGTVDRWFGQAMKASQVARIKMYYQLAEICDVPLWAHGLRFYAMRQESCCGYALSWDFGLLADLQLLLPMRKHGGRPFMWWGNLWQRLELRREHLLRSAAAIRRDGVMSMIVSQSFPELRPYLVFDDVGFHEWESFQSYVQSRHWPVTPPPIALEVHGDVSGDLVALPVFAFPASSSYEDATSAVPDALTASSRSSLWSAGALFNAASPW